MVDIQSKEIIDKMSDDLKVQPAMQLPRELGKQILPVYNVNPVRNIDVKSVNVNDTATAIAIHTTSATKRTFLIGVSIAVNKDVVNVGTNSLIRANVTGNLTVATNLLIVRYESVTAGSFNENIMFPIPIEITKNTSIEFKHNGALASIDGTGIVYFYETDPQ